MRIFISLLILLYPILTHCQADWESGTIVLQSGESISCSILDEDWKRTPLEFTYKLNGGEQKISADAVQSVSLADHTLFESEMVAIDEVADDVSITNDKRNPPKVQKQLLLRVLVDGDIDLLKYSTPQQTRFYTRTSSSSELLEYNLYRSGTAMGTNAAYKQQMTLINKCNPTTDYSKLSYKEKPLVKAVVAANECLGIQPKVYGDDTKRKLGKLHVELGMLYQSVAVNVQATRSKSNEFNNGVGCYAGLGYEYYLPYGNNSMSVTAAATYAAVSIDGEPELNDATFDYSGAMISLGLRRYFPVGGAQLAVGVEAVVENVLNAEINYESSSNIELFSGVYPRLMAGLVQKDRYSLLVRYDIKNPTRNYVAITSNNTSFMVGLAVSVF